MSLAAIQKDLKVPKKRHNKFSDFKYRNLEDILEVVKPMLAELNWHIIIVDDIQQIGERIYVKAHCKIMQENNLIAESFGFARETVTKKGMDESQITGSASSYARKYAMNGLFALDDSEEIDEKDNTSPTLTKAQKASLAKLEKAKTVEELQQVFNKIKESDREILKDDARKCREILQESSNET